MGEQGGRSRSSSVSAAAGASLNEEGVRCDLRDTNWASLLSRNTDFFLGPEEIMADNFAIPMERRHGGVVPVGNASSGFPITDVGLLDSLQSVLGAACHHGRH